MPHYSTAIRLEARPPSRADLDAYARRVGRADWPAVTYSESWEDMFHTRWMVKDDVLALASHPDERVRHALVSHPEFRDKEKEFRGFPPTRSALGDMLRRELGEAEIHGLWTPVLIAADGFVEWQDYGLGLRYVETKSHTLRAWLQDANEAEILEYFEVHRPFGAPLSVEVEALRYARRIGPQMLARMTAHADEDRMHRLEEAAVRNTPADVAGTAAGLVERMRVNPSSRARWNMIRAMEWAVRIGGTLDPADQELIVAASAEGLFGSVRALQVLLRAANARSELIEVLSKAKDHPLLDSAVCNALAAHPNTPPDLLRRTLLHGAPIERIRAIGAHPALVRDPEAMVDVLGALVTDSPHVAEILAALPNEVRRTLHILVARLHPRVVLADLERDAALDAEINRSAVAALLVHPDAQVRHDVILRLGEVRGLPDLGRSAVDSGPSRGHRSPGRGGVP